LAPRLGFTFIRIRHSAIGMVQRSDSDLDSLDPGPDILLNQDPDPDQEFFMTKYLQNLWLEIFFIKSQKPSYVSS
jgi:hypothetical protein